MSFVVVKSHPDLLKYVESLQAQNSDELGFLPRVVFENRVEVGQVFLGLLNGEPCGYILAGSGFRGIMRCLQVAIQYDVRRRLYGATLVQAVEDYGESLGCRRIDLRCGSDLPANEFWKSVGYDLVGTEESGAARRYRRHINVWSKPLIPAIIATWEHIRADAGRRGGQSCSDAKIIAARLNGRKGGRPRTQGSAVGTSEVSRNPSNDRTGRCLGYSGA